MIGEKLTGWMKLLKHNEELQVGWELLALSRTKNLEACDRMEGSLVHVRRVFQVIAYPTIPIPFLLVLLNDWPIYVTLFLE